MVLSHRKFGEISYVTKKESCKSGFSAFAVRDRVSNKFTVHRHS